jgi:hypothetical protein
MAVVQIQPYGMKKEVMLEKRSAEKLALEYEGKANLTKRNQPKEQRKTPDSASSAGTRIFDSGEIDSELEEANRGLPLGWKARRSKNRIRGRIYWYCEGGIGAESQWHKPSDALP